MVQLNDPCGCPVAPLVLQVEAFMELLLQNSKIRAATHNILSYRIRVERPSKHGGEEAVAVWLQDFDDDGEDAAGGRLLHMMQLANCQNVVRGEGGGGQREPAVGTVFGTLGLLDCQRRSCCGCLSEPGPNSSCCCRWWWSVGGMGAYCWARRAFNISTTSRGSC